LATLAAQAEAQSEINDRILRQVGQTQKQIGALRLQLDSSRSTLDSLDSDRMVDARADYVGHAAESARQDGFGRKLQHR
jgi:hypothetical protein